VVFIKGMVAAFDASIDVKVPHLRTATGMNAITQDGKQAWNKHATKYHRHTHTHLKCPKFTSEGKTSQLDRNANLQLVTTGVE
jgi:hypothetical protein